MSVFTGYWQEKTKKVSGGKATGKMTVIRLTPYGWDAHSYLMRQEAEPSSRKFKTVEELKFPGDDGAKAAILHYLSTRAALAETALELVPDASIVLFPPDLEKSRPKTHEESIMDEAMLHVELHSYDRADELLKQLQSESESLFALTIARRIAQNRAAGLPESQSAEKRKWMKIAAVHSLKIIDMTAGKDLYRMESYGFGDDYRSTPSLVACAATTAGDYLLNHEQSPEQALQAFQVADDTAHGGSWLQELKVKALLQLDRNAEAFSNHKLWRLNMEQVVTRPDYQGYLDGDASTAARKEAERVAAIRIHTVPGKSASKKGIKKLVETFGPLPQDYLQWIGQHALSELHVEDGDSTEEYRVFTPEEALERHGEVMGWLHLHDDSSPEMSEELFAILSESGINPSQMLPIAGNDQSPDCFLLRLDGAQRGQVYFWGHDEMAMFDVITQRVEDLFAYLETRARAGETFVL